MRRAARRDTRDVNDDGRRDFVVRTQIDDPDCERGRPGQLSRSHEEQTFFYDAGHDEWVSAPGGVPGVP